MIEQSINGIELKFETSNDVFSPQACDKGTLAMLAAAEITKGDKILDLGCGYGLIGIYAAKITGEENVVMSDIKKKCVELSKMNAALNGVGGIKTVQSDGFNNMEETGFDIILSNPPYHADFSVPKHFIEKGFNRLKIGGTMYMVTKRKTWYKNKFTAIFGRVKIIEIDGYFIFRAEKRGNRYASAEKKKTR